MAGAGRRVFQPGEVLTASNVMNYLQDQAVQVYAGTAARGSAIGTAISEGMVSYLKDTDDLQVYTDAWKSIGPAGRIAQVVTASTTTWISVTSTTFTDTSLTASITPKFSTSKIIALVTQAIYVQRNSSTYAIGGFRLLRDSTALDDNTSNLTAGLYAAGATSVDIRQTPTRIYLDTPNSTSAITYKTQIASSESTTTTSAQDNNRLSRIILIEVTA